MRLGRVFTWAAKGRNPEPGTFNFVENAAASDPFAASGTFASSGPATAAAAATAAAESSPSSYGGDAGLGGGDSGHLNPPPPVPGYFGTEANGQGGEFGFGGNGHVGEPGAGTDSGFDDARGGSSDSSGMHSGGGAGGAGAEFVGGCVEGGLWGPGAGGGAGEGWSQPSECSYPDLGVSGSSDDGVVGEISGISGGGSSRHRGRVPGEMGSGAGAGAEGGFVQGGEASSPRPQSMTSPEERVPDGDWRENFR